VKLAAKERYAASWEYMLDEALFTTPPHPEWWQEVTAPTSGSQSATTPVD